MTIITKNILRDSVSSVARDCGYTIRLIGSVRWEIFNDDGVHATFALRSAGAEIIETGSHYLADRVNTEIHNRIHGAVMSRDASIAHDTSYWAERLGR